MPARMEFNFDLGRKQASRDTARASGGPMRLLVMGDFSGNAVADRPPLASRPTHRVDVDTLDDTLRRLAPRVSLLEGELRLEAMEDFHPDELYARFELFDALRQARAQPPAGGGSDLLGSLLGQRGAAAAVPATTAPATGIDAFIHSIVAPHIVQDYSAQTESYTRAVDAAIAEQMRKLLHEPAFQHIEAAWRGVQWLIANAELDENLQLHLFDVTRDELLADVVEAKGQLTQTGVYRALADRWRNVPGGERWSVLVGLYRFGRSDADVGLLAALGLIAAQAGGPLLAEADPALAGDDELGGWHALRRSEAAPSIGLAAPRFLLRLPYGKGSDPVSSFAFEEFTGTPLHEHFLWGNPGLAVALLIARGFSARGWKFEPGDEREIGDLPAVTLMRDGEKELQACAEHYLGDQRGQSFLDAGLMPLLSHRQRNAVTVMRVQSIAEPAEALAVRG